MRACRAAGLACSLVLGVVAGWLAARSGSPVLSAPVLPSAAGGDVGRVFMGNEYTVTPRLVPDVVVRTSRGEALQYHLEVDSKNSGDMRVAYDVRLYDDTGKLLRVYDVSSGALTAQNSLVGRPFEIGGLSDGFYRLEAIVAAAGGERETAIRTSQYLAVESGHMTEVSLEEYVERSRSRECAAVDLESANWPNAEMRGEPDSNGAGTGGAR